LAAERLELNVPRIHMGLVVELERVRLARGMVFVARAGCVESEKDRVGICRSLESACVVTLVLG
jgi:hypothetical protein